MNGIRVSSRLFQDHLAQILRAGGFEQSKAEKCLFIHRKMKVSVTVHVDDPIVAGTSEGLRMFFKLMGTKLKVKENPAWSTQAQVFLGANFSRPQMEVDGIKRDVIIEAGMEKGSAVGTAGIKPETAGEADEYIGEDDHKIYRSVCRRLQFASPRRKDILLTLKELGRGLAKPMKSHYQ
eukprot:4553604-Amphidinium_carterae.4